MTPEELAHLHARAFDGPRAWNAAEFEALLEGRGVFLTSMAGGFALGRAIAAEAEILTLAVNPEFRRQGIGRALLAQLETEAEKRGAERVYLEVAEDNSAAIGLYASVGYVESGRRRRYYQLPGGKWIDAILMDKPLILA